MNLGTLKDRLNKRYLAGVAAALAVAAIACLWLLPSTYEQQLGEARRCWKPASRLSMPTTGVIIHRLPMAKPRKSI